MDYEKNDKYDGPSASAMVVPAQRSGPKLFGWHLQVPQNESSFALGTASNADFDPVPPSKRTWGPLSFLAYWMSDAWAITNFEIGSSMVAVGLSWKMAIGITVLGNTIMGLVITINGRIGSTTHAPFPVLARMSFGYYLSYFAIVSRGILAIFWLGIQTVAGGQCMLALIYAMSPSFATWPNHIPTSQGITSAGMIAYACYFALQIPLFWIPFYRIQAFFSFKAIIAPICFIGIFGRTVYLAHGKVDAVAGSTTLHGSAFAWAFLNNLNSVLGNYATLGLNISDFSRYSKKKNSQDIQVILIPVIFTVVGIFGIFFAAASVAAYPELAQGTAIWNPLTVVQHWALTGGPAGRCAAAFCAIGLLITTLGINIAANSLSAANDLVGLCPKYINIRRGQILAAFIGGWVFVPWLVLASAEKFLSFMSGYTIFLGPLTGILMTDYYFLRRKNVSVPEMYNFEGIYKYNGLKSNWRAALALVIGFLPPLPGLCNYITPSLTVTSGEQKLFYLGYIYSFIASSLVYYGTSKFFPPTESLLSEPDLGEDAIAAMDNEPTI